MTRAVVATAGWSIPRAVAEAFPHQGSALERYAARFGGVEINSTFYRSHRPSTYARWVAATPSSFRFAVKLPRAITHEARLVDTDALLCSFRKEVEALGEKLGPLLVQLPASLAFSIELHAPFFERLGSLWPEPIVCEPRHASWFESQADTVLYDCRVSRVAADPAHHPGAGQPGGWPGLAYWRLHGSPRIYSSSYDGDTLGGLASSLAAAATGDQVWCVFDNTASGAAAANALALQDMITHDPPRADPR